MQPSLTFTKVTTVWPFNAFLSLCALSQQTEDLSLVSEMQRALLNILSVKCSVFTPYSYIHEGGWEWGALLKTERNLDVRLKKGSSHTENNATQHSRFHRAQELLTIICSGTSFSLYIALTLFQYIQFAQTPFTHHYSLSIGSVSCEGLCVSVNDVDRRRDEDIAQEALCRKELRFELLPHGMHHYCCRLWRF